MKKILLYVLTASFLALASYSCKKDPKPVEEEKIPEETLATNEWISENMNLYYYWNDMLPTSIDYTKEADPEAYFYKLLYDEKDKWSYITNDYASLKAELEGNPVTMGYYPAFYLVGSNKVAIAVGYVYPGSAAANAGLKRGDIILSIDNTQLDTTNYYNLYSGTGYSAQLGTLVGNNIVSSGISISMTARVTDTDPAIYHQVLDIDGHKIGYLVYVEFIAGTNDAYLLALDNIFNEFKAAGISDLIVDLRYNPGGEVDAALHLASEIAPASVISGNKTLIDLKYNTELEAYLQANYPSYLYYKFENNASNIDMQRVYFLTTSRSASASELVITGLDPYMDVKQIGEPTYGKYCGAWVMPDDNEKWAMMPIVSKFANSSGYTDFVDGLTPDYPIDDELIGAVPFGDVSDPMMAKAIELATGVTVPVKRAKSIGLEEYKRLVPPEMNIRNNLLLRGIGQTWW